MITKDICKDFALKIKLETGKFPIQSDWIVNNGYPCGYWKLLSLFGGSYNNFRDYCGEPHLLRTQKISLDWMRLNCNIDVNGCWNWNKTIKLSGYGHITIGGKSFLVHRVCYILAFGDIPEGHIIRHKCDNRKCCNPDHLELGTQSQNIQDFYDRNTDYKSKNNPMQAFITKSFETIDQKIKYHLDNAVVQGNCLICSTLTPLTNGYYNIHINGKYLKFHRLVLANKLNKEYSQIKVARHSCNNKLCINPEHLLDGSNKDNSLDSRSYSKATKLTVQDVKDIRFEARVTDFSKKGSKSLFDKKWSAKLQVSTNTILNIRLYNHYKDITI